MFRKVNTDGDKQHLQNDLDRLVKWSGALRKHFNAMIYIGTVVAFSSLTLLLCNVALSQNNCKPKDCIDLKCYRISTGHDGPHTVYPGIAKLTTMPVSCDQTVEGGGWMVWMHRSAEVNDTNFNQTFDGFKKGFGRHGGPDTEYYMGNENVHLLTQSGNLELRLDGVTYFGDNCSIGAMSFKMDSATQGYEITMGTTINLFKVHKEVLNSLNGRRFTRGDAHRCGKVTGWTHWWYSICTDFFLFGSHANVTVAHSNIYISDCAVIGDIGIMRTKLLLRPFNDSRQCNNPCENGGTCLYDAKTNKSSCQCTTGFGGSICSDDPPEKSAGSLKLLPLFIGVFVLTILTGLAVCGYLVYRKKKREEEEEAERQRQLEAEEEEEESGFFGFLGF